MSRHRTDPRRAPRQQSRQRLHLAREIASIQRRAADHDGRVVSIGPLVFFSTDTGDAWLLEPADSLACRLAIGGDALDVDFEESGTGFAIGWQGRYHIEGEAFMYVDSAAGRRITIFGYPVHLLRRPVGGN
jgi:hypothetical protein